MSLAGKEGKFNGRCIKILIHPNLQTKSSAASGENSANLFVFFSATFSFAGYSAISMKQRLTFSIKDA